MTNPRLDLEDALNAAEAEAKIKSDTLAKAAASPPPSAADTVVMMAQTKTAQQFLIGLIALCMQADGDRGSVMFYMKPKVARFTVVMRVRGGHPMNFYGEGENLFTAAAQLHGNIQRYLHAGTQAHPPPDHHPSDRVDEPPGSPPAPQV